MYTSGRIAYPDQALDLLRLLQALPVASSISFRFAHHLTPTSATPRRSTLVHNVGRASTTYPVLHISCSTSYRSGLGGRAHCMRPSSQYRLLRK
eukprot:282448-Heterocapsa_arctica.AAC.1